MPETIALATIASSSIKSECGEFRYVLKRVWDADREVGAFLCANPSKADHLLTDDTVYRCGNLAVQWNWGGYYVLNLFPGYATNPADLKRTSETDSRNAFHIAAVFAEVNRIVIACGNGHAVELSKAIAGVPREKLMCLRRNRGGGFLHPSRIKPENFPEPIPAYP